MNTYKNLSIDDMAFFLNHAKDLTVLEMSRALKYSPTKIQAEFKKLNIVPIVRQRQKRFSSGTRQPKKFKYVSGLMPKAEKPLVRAPAEYSNGKSLYPDLEERYSKLISVGS